MSPHSSASRHWQDLQGQRIDFGLDHLPFPAFAVSGGQVLVDANRAAYDLFGAEVSGGMLHDLFEDAGPVLRTADWDGVFPVVATRKGRFRACLGEIGPHGRILSLLPEPDGVLSGIVDQDELTGLLRRGGLTTALDRAIAEQRRAAVHCIDLDRFKIINDTLGHAVGDALLTKVADRIRSACRKGDCIARIGGDEFVIVQQEVAHEGDAIRLAERLVDLLGRTYILEGHTINIAASIGIALTAGIEASARDMLRNADLALYEAKRAGRSCYRLFEPTMEAALCLRREMEIDLRRALALRQFELHYQPFLDLKTNRIIGFEALIRWNHPQKGNISPADFIPLAEETGLIEAIGEWVLRTACTAAAGWPEGMTIAVNVSPVQFRSQRLVSKVVSALAQSQIAAHRLELEITEGALLDNTDDVLATLHQLKELGVRISMDDFGTGYSSLSYLQKFPFNKIKIDRSFIQNMHESEESGAIVKAITGLATSLGISITAEGVETPAQLLRIRHEHCTHAQGYLTGRPMPAAAVFQLFEE